MKIHPTLINTLVLLRFPFSVYLMPVFFFALSQAEVLDPGNALVSFLILHLLVYPASNGYNSLMDQDTDSIGGLEAPPPPPALLGPVTFGMDILAVSLGWLCIGNTFAIMVAGYILASRMYSNRRIRLKKYPIIGFLVVFIFQGGFTYIMASVGCAEGQLDVGKLLTSPLLYPVLISSLMIGGGYPLTQVYQHEADRENGDRTLSMLLGYKGTFIFSIIMFLLVNGLFFLYFIPEQALNFFLLQLFLIPLIGWFLIWMRKTWKDSEEANFRNMMRMNNLSAVCMNGFYILLAALNHIF